LQGNYFATIFPDLSFNFPANDKKPLKTKFSNRDAMENFGPCVGIEPSTFCLNVNCLIHLSSEALMRKFFLFF
jgi:hypothetical protein